MIFPVLYGYNKQHTRCCSRRNICSNYGTNTYYFFILPLDESGKTCYTKEVDKSRFTVLSRGLGVAQLVACYLGVVEAARSSRVTQTKEKPRSFGRIPETAWFCFVVLFFIEIDCQVKYNTIILCSCALGVKFYYAGSNVISEQNTLCP